MPGQGQLTYGALGGASNAYVNGTGLHVTDGNVERVRVGDVSTAGDGSAFGLQIFDPGGPNGTVIIDGTSDMFRISATGTLSLTQATDSSGSTTVSLPGLGAQSTTPAGLHDVSAGNASTANRDGFHYFEFANDVFVAPSSGASPTQRAAAINWHANVYTDLDGSNFARVTLAINNMTGVSKTAYYRWYVLAQTAI